MAITWTGAGGLFTRVGKIVGAMKTFRAWISSGGTLEVEIDDITDEFSTADIDWIADVLSDVPKFKDSINSVIMKLRDHAIVVLAEQLHAEDPFPANAAAGGPTLGLEVKSGELVGIGNRTLGLRLNDLMDADAQTFQESTVSAAATSADDDNVGDGTVVVSLLSTEGETAEMMYGENLEIRCVADSQHDPSRLGLEHFTIRGEASVSRDDPDWPRGSGVVRQARSVGSKAEGGSGTGMNMLVNSGSERFTLTDAPDTWPVVAGVVGTDIKKTTTAFRGTNALHILNGGSSPLTELEQAFDTLSGTPSPFISRSVYAIRAHLRHDGTVLTGSYDLELYDDTGTILKVTTDLSTLTASYAAVGGQAYFERAVNGTVKMRRKITTSPLSGRGFFEDELTVCRMMPLAAQGPHLTVYPGAVDSLKDDFFRVALTNNREGEWIQELIRILGIEETGILFPTVGGAAETIGDALIS